MQQAAEQQNARPSRVPTLSQQLSSKQGMWGSRSRPHKRHEVLIQVLLEAIRTGVLELQSGQGGWGGGDLNMNKLHRQL